MTIGRIKKPILIIMTSLILILGTFALVLPYQEAEAAPAILCIPDILNTEITGNVVVKAGVVCDIVNSTVNGKIRVAKGGNLRCENSTINGDLIARGANFVQLTNCTVTGKVSVLNGGFFGLFVGSILEGDLTLRGNLNIDLFDSEVRGKAVCARNGDPDTAGMTYLGTNKGC